MTGKQNSRRSGKGQKKKSKKSSTESLMMSVGIGAGDRCNLARRTDSI